MPIVRKRLAPSEVYPDDIRYNPNGDKVEVLIDGVWTDAPESDPRKQTTLPPRITADPACDAAQSIADALENQIAQIIQAIDNGLTLFQIAGIILGIFSFGVFAIFINIALGIADFLFGLGSTAIQAALPSSAFETLRCILYCHMDNQGRIIEGEIPAIQQEIVDQIGTTGGTILNSMIDLAGIGGLNNIAAAGTSTGDCSACDCGCVSDCAGAPTTTNYQYNSPNWVVHGAFTRYNANTPVGQFDSFTLAGTTAVLDLIDVKCVTQIDVVMNNGCGPTLGADVEVFIGAVSQGVKNVADRVGCGTPSASWVIVGGLLTDQISAVQVGAACAGGHNDYLICVKITSCVP